jgi:hypothetical protein
VAGADLPGRGEPFSAAHVTRWPPGAVLDNGELCWPGEFDERDAVVAGRAFPGCRIRVEPGTGLVAGPVPEREPLSGKWTDEDGTRWHELGGLAVYQRPGYLAAHPAFWTYHVRGGLADADPDEIDEAAWASVESRGWLSSEEGLAGLDVSVGGGYGAVEVRLEHGPVLWPLDVPAGHRMGLRVGGTPCHDPRLGVVAPAWEQAIVALAARVRCFYGDDRAWVGA